MGEASRQGEPWEQGGESDKMGRERWVGASYVLPGQYVVARTLCYAY